MKFRLSSRNSVVALSALLAVPLFAIAQKARPQNAPHFPHYTVTDLGVLGSGNNSSSFDMNYFGWVAGSSNLTPGGPQHAFIWYSHGPLKDLGTLDGAACPQCNSAADGPNIFGQTAIGSEIKDPDPNGEDFLRLRDAS